MRYHAVTIKELAAARKDAYDAVARRWGERRMPLIYGIERCILEYPIRRHRDVAEMRDILFQFGEPDYADHFNRKLAAKLLRAV